MHARRRLAGAAVLAALFIVPVWPASAAVPSAHGYWWHLQTGTGPTLPKPPFVPPDGLWVASDASGQQAVSAVRYRAPAGVEIRSLVLKVYRNSGQDALLLACPAASSWKPAEAGAWSAQPKRACDVAFVKGVESTGRSSWTFDVRGMGRSGTLDVVILSPEDDRDTFSISFDPPDSSSIVTERLPGSSSTGSTSAAEESPHAGRVTPRATVLASETSPSSVSSPASPSGSDPTSSFTTQPPGLQASQHIEDEPPRGVVIAVAAALAVLALIGLAGRALLRRSEPGG